MKKKRILVVEDELIISEDICIIVKNCGYSVAGVITSGEDAVSLAAELYPDLVLMDIMLENNMTGLEAAETIFSDLEIPIIFLTAYADDETLKKVLKTEPYGYIIKPFDEKELRVTLELAFYKHAMEKELKLSEEKYRSIFENIQDVYYEVDMNGIILEMSPSIEVFTKHLRQYLIGKQIDDFYAEPKQGNEMLIKLHDKGSVNGFEIDIKDKNGDVINCSVTSKLLLDDNDKPQKIVGSLRNITDHKEMEKYLLQTERLAGVGQLAAGIAHEIRNPLGNISSAVQFCITKYKPSKEIKQYLDMILRNSDNANKIIKELLDFATPREINLKKESITKILDNTIELVKARFLETGVNIKKKYSDGIPDILIDEKWMERSFLNLIVNAIDAMSNGSLLTITVVLKDNSIILSFKDTGKGISDENLTKVFDPFFTTKDDGTGLGMSSVFQVITAHNGTINVKSKVRKGTNVIISLPISKN